MASPNRDLCYTLEAMADPPRRLAPDSLCEVQ
jgi:hypothetical protein